MHVYNDSRKNAQSCIYSNLDHICSYGVSGMRFNANHTYIVCSLILDWYLHSENVLQKEFNFRLLLYLFKSCEKLEKLCCICKRIFYIVIVIHFTKIQFHLYETKNVSLVSWSQKCNFKKILFLSALNFGKIPCLSVGNVRHSYLNNDRTESVF